MEDNKVTNVQSFIVQLPELPLKSKGDIFYRGQASVDYNLSPSVLRDNIKKEAEYDIYEQIMVSCSSDFDSDMSHCEVLSKMQHYGVPTRMMDLTTNALVALYFACIEDTGKDGAVYVLHSDKHVDKHIKAYDSDTISILSSLPKFSLSDQNKIGKFAATAAAATATAAEKQKSIKKFNEKRVVKRLLHEVKKEKPAFENIIDPNDLLSNFIFIPKKNNARIIRQSGCFLIFGLNEGYISCNDFKLYSKSNANNGSYRIIIDKKDKKKILEQLACFGLSTAEIYPELYKVAEYFRDKQSKPFGTGEISK